MSKLSFKVKSEKRVLDLDLELESGEKVELKCCKPSFNVLKNDESIYSIFKNMIRKTEDLEQKLGIIEEQMDIDQITELIDFILKEITLKKK